MTDILCVPASAVSYTSDMRDIDRHLYTAAQVRESDRRAIEMCGISGHELMRRAAASCWAVIRERSPVAATISIACGPGNTAGDGYATARLATQDNWDAHVQLGSE